jgi:putative endonuclease
MTLFYVSNRGAMHERRPCTYILASQKGGTLYIGVTSDIAARLWQHRNGATPGFASGYRAIRLVHAEFSERMADAIAREKQLKIGTARGRST